MTRLYQAVKEKTGTEGQSNLARLMNESPQVIKNWETRGISKQGLVKASRLFGVSTTWIETGAPGNEAMSPSNHYFVEPNASMLGGFDLWDSETPLNDDEVALNFFREVELSAGAGRTHVVENGGRKLRFAKSTLRDNGIQAHHAACVTVSGSSMEPVMQHGTTVGIDTSVTRIIDGEVYAIDHEGQLRVKLLYRLPGGGLRIRSYNSDEYPDEILSAEQAKSVKVLGWVFWVSTLRKRRF